MLARSPWMLGPYRPSCSTHPRASDGGGRRAFLLEEALAPRINLLQALHPQENPEAWRGESRLQALRTLVAELRLRKKGTELLGLEDLFIHLVVDKQPSGSQALCGLCTRPGARGPFLLRWRLPKEEPSPKAHSLDAGSSLTHSRFLP